ncbi:MAG TPA: hypothetical protein VNP73_01650 [Actinomycetota bacterium]|nr:hypothetical protein [Actinomycetota bacterium]
MKRALICLLTFVALASVVPVAAQDESQPPDLVFRSGDTRQRGNLGSYCWESPSGSKCEDTFSFDWPPPDQAKSRAKARVVLKYPEKPKQMSLDYWRRVNENGEPAGRPHGIEFRLEPRDGRRGRVWDAKFRLPSSGRFYMRAFAQWDAGDGFYDFNIVLD